MTNCSDISAEMSYPCHKSHRNVTLINLEINFAGDFPSVQRNWIEWREHEISFLAFQVRLRLVFPITASVACSRVVPFRWNVPQDECLAVLPTIPPHACACLCYTDFHSAPLPFANSIPSLLLIASICKYVRTHIFVALKRYPYLRTVHSLVFRPRMWEN